MGEAAQDFDPERYRIHDPDPVVTFNPRTQERVRGSKFVRVPLVWLEAAQALPGKAALIVGLRLWFLAGCRKKRTVALNLSRLSISRETAWRALATLQRAKGWAVLFGVILLETGLHDNPRNAVIGERTLRCVAASM